MTGAPRVRQEARTRPGLLPFVLCRMAAGAEGEKVSCRVEKDTL